MKHGTWWTRTCMDYHSCITSESIQAFNLRSVAIKNNKCIFYLNTFYNYAHNILGLSDILPNVSFTLGEMKHDY